MLNRSFVETRIHKSAAAAAEAAPTEKFELTNIRVEEVSLVDHPANQVEFLVTKRDGVRDERKGRGMPDATPSAFADLDKADEAAVKAAKDAEDKAQSDREKEILAAAEKGEPSPPKSEPKEGEPPVTNAGEPPAGDDKSGDKPADDDKTEERPVVPPKEEEPAAKTKADDVDPSVEKKGAKMARARREQLKAARKVIDDLLAAVEPEDEGEEKGAEKADPPPKEEEPAKDPPPKADPPAKDPPKEEPKPSTAVAPPSQTAKSADSEELARLRSLVEGLQKMVKDQGEQLAKSRLPADSNTISLEKSNLGHDKVPWPADLAAPQERIKGRSF